MATVLATIQVGLRRAGLEETNTAYKDYGRTYLNAVIKEIEGDATWWWKFKTGTITTTKTMTLSGIGSSEQYTAGDTITGSSSSATATVVSHTAGESTLTFKSESGTFTTSDTVSGTSSGDLGTYVSDTATRLYDGASTVPVQSLVSAFNETSNNVLGIERPRIIQRYDPDLSDSGTPCFLYPWGINDSGVVQLALFPRDSTTNETITYQYYSYTPDFTEDDYSKSLDPYIHPTLQSGLFFGIARLLKQQEGDDEGGLVEEAEFQKVLQRARRNNINIFGDNVTRQLYPPMTAPAFNFTVREGSL